VYKFCSNAEFLSQVVVLPHTRVCKLARTFYHGPCPLENGRPPLAAANGQGAHDHQHVEQSGAATEDGLLGTSR